MKKNDNYDFKNLVWPSFADAMIIVLSVFVIISISINKNADYLKKEIDKIKKDKDKNELKLKNEIKILKEVDITIKESLEELKNSYPNLIKEKEGKYYISENEIKFNSGESSIRDTDKQKLILLIPGIKKIIDELEKKLPNKNIFIVISGHTDNKNIKTNKFEDNWDLSSSRASNVIRFMLNNGLDKKYSKNFLSSGFSEYHPISQKDQDNRRIEISISAQNRI